MNNRKSAKKCSFVVWIVLLEVVLMSSCNAQVVEKTENAAINNVLDEMFYSVVKEENSHKTKASFSHMENLKGDNQVLNWIADDVCNFVYDTSELESISSIDIYVDTSDKKVEIIGTCQYNDVSVYYKIEYSAVNSILVYFPVVVSETDSILAPVDDSKALVVLENLSLDSKLQAEMFENILEKEVFRAWVEGNVGFTKFSKNNYGTYQIETVENGQKL